MALHSAGLEFLAFMLIKSGIIDMDNVRDAMKNFDELDVDGSGPLFFASGLREIRDLSTSCRGTTESPHKPTQYRLNATPRPAEVDGTKSDRR